MNILVSIDNNYALPLMVTLKSLFDNNKYSTHTVYLLHDEDMNAETMSEIINFITAENHKIVTIKVSKDDFVGFPVQRTHITLATYFRCFAFEFLPKDMDRILYLDADIIVNKDIKDLYDIDFDDNYLIAAGGPSLQTKLKADLNIPDDKTYFNSGVLLYNLKKFNKEFDSMKIYEWLRIYKTKMIFHDQDILNGLFFDKVKIVDKNKYNHFAWFSLDGYFKYLINKNNIIKSISILHYGGKNKPWKLRYEGRYSNIYWKYAIKTPMKKYFHIRIFNSIRCMFFIPYRCLRKLVKAIFRMAGVIPET